MYMWAAFVGITKYINSTMKLRGDVLKETWKELGAEWGTYDHILLCTCIKFSSMIKVKANKQINKKIIVL